MKPSNIIILAAGGTGGHIFPAEALAESLRARGFAPHLITDHRFHHYSKLPEGSALKLIPIHTIRAGSLGGSAWQKIKSMVGIIIGVTQAMRLIMKLQPMAVVGFGGYPSFPTMLASVILRKRTILHEQNSVLGKVNRLLAEKVNVIATTYEQTQKMPPAAVNKVRYTGNPIRAAVKALRQVAYPELPADGMMRILVIGGSQGASMFSDVVPQAMALLPKNLRARIRLDQQCRAPEVEQVREKYAALGMQVDLAPFFSDVAARLAAAHLVISRAGASSVAELMVAGRPAILVPLPSATDNHQYFNAEAVEDKGAGWVVTQEAFTPQSLATRLETLLQLPKRLSECAGAMHQLGTPDAAEKLADVVVGR